MNVQLCYTKHEVPDRVVALKCTYHISHNLKKKINVKQMIF